MAADRIKTTLIIAIERLIPSTKSVKEAFKIGIQAWDSTYRWLGSLRTVGAVVNSNAKVANAIKATKMAAALFDFFPVKYTKGKLIAGRTNTANKVKDIFYTPMVNIIKTTIRMKPSTAAAM